MNRNRRPVIDFITDWVIAAVMSFVVIAVVAFLPFGLSAFISWSGGPLEVFASWAMVRIVAVFSAIFATWFAISEIPK